MSAKKEKNETERFYSCGKDKLIFQPRQQLNKARNVFSASNVDKMSES